MMTNGTPSRIIKMIQPGTGARLALDEVTGGVGSFMLIILEAGEGTASCTVLLER